MYRKKETSAGRVKYVQKYYPGRYGAPGMEREGRRKPTPEEMARQNQRNRERRVQLLICGNFREGDWHVTLTYPKEERPPDIREAKRDFGRFIRRAGYRFQKAGIPFKWIAVTEVGKRGAAHHHMIIEDIRTDGFSARDVILECWRGGRAFYPLYEEGEFRELAEYLVKRETKEDGEGRACGTSFTHSRNLTPPKERTEDVRATRWRDPPRAPEGWELMEGTVARGHNPVTGLPCLSYFLRRIEPKKTAQGRGKEGSGGKDGNAGEAPRQDRGRPAADCGGGKHGRRDERKARARRHYEPRPDARSRGLRGAGSNLGADGRADRGEGAGAGGRGQQGKAK